MELKSDRPVGPPRREVDEAPLRHEAGEPRQQAEVHGHRGRLGPRRRLRGRDLAELGYNVLCFCYQDSPRRAHSIAAQGGINAAKNYQNDGDSVYRLFYDTIKGGDFRAREANVYRLAEVSVNIIDQCVAQGVPFAREYGGTPREPLLRRRAGLAHLLRPRPDGAAAPPRRLPGPRAADRPRRGEDVHAPRDARARRRRRPGPRHRDARHGDRARSSRAPPTPSSSRPAATATSSTSRRTPRGATTTAIWRAYKKGAGFANPCYTQIHPTCIPVTGEHQSKLTLMSESLRNDGRIWVPLKKGDKRAPDEIPEEERDYYLERKYPSFGNLAPRDIASRAAKQVCDEGRGVGPTGLGVYLDFADAIKRLGQKTIAERYGNLFEMYERITDENPYKIPMRIFPASHYTMGGLWVDYNLMTHDPRPASCWARPTSRTTAPTASARAP